MILTINMADKVISLDGFHAQFDFPVFDPTIEVIQWVGESLHGTVQRKSGTEPFKDPAFVKPYLDFFSAERLRRAQLELSNAQSAADSYGFKHANEKVAYGKNLEAEAAYLAEVAKVEAEQAAKANDASG